MAARMVNAVPTANTNLAGFGFGAMFPSWLFCWYQVSVLVPDCRIFKDPIAEVYELLHSSPLVQKMMGRLTIRDTRSSLAPALLSGLFPYWPRLFRTTRAPCRSLAPRPNLLRKAGRG